MSLPPSLAPPLLTQRSELGEVAKLESEWKKRNVKTLGLSCNELKSHDKWIEECARATRLVHLERPNPRARSINELSNVKLSFPIVADPERKVSRASCPPVRTS